MSTAGRAQATDREDADAVTRAYEIVEHSYDVVIVGAGSARRAYRPVHLHPFSNEVASIPPKGRVY
jgi:hypothetical protein